MPDKNHIINTLLKEMEGFKAEAAVEKVGKILEVGDGIAKISGLSNCMSSEMLEFENGAMGVALNLEEDSIGAVILGDYLTIKEGQSVKSTGRILQVPVGPGLVGRVVNPLGEPIDGKGKLKTEIAYPVEKVAPGVITRQSVTQPVQTGIKAIDGLIPIGRGQRELIIGDRQTGKTALAIDTIINQKGQKMKCVYVAIGQKESKVAKIINKLQETGAMEYTTVVLASASDPASLLFIAPYAGSAIAEYFMDKGEDVLVVYDDLSKHAVAYRQISLLLRRPPGREAYPGDIFYLHSRLLERSAKLNKDFGGGSITALPIIETQAGDVSAYIPTNVISITDGQIYLETDLFYQGVRPAINIGLSVSRVGSAAQIKAMKKVAGKLKLDLAQFRELAAFAQFGSDLDETTKKQLQRGKMAVEILKQDQYLPVPVEKQVVIFYSFNKGLLDSVPLEKMKVFESGLYEYLSTNCQALLSEIVAKGELNESLEKGIEKAVTDYKNLARY